MATNLLHIQLFFFVLRENAERVHIRVSSQEQRDLLLLCNRIVPQINRQLPARQALQHEEERDDVKAVVLQVHSCQAASFSTAEASVNCSFENWWWWTGS